VHLAGQPADLDPLWALGLPVVEDAAHAVESAYRGRKIGALSEATCFSLYATKNVAAGEGGMITTHSEDEHRLLLSLRNQGRADGGGWLEHARLGFNYRLDDIRAAIGIGQLEKLDLILAGRAAVAARYHELLADVPGLGLPCPDDESHERSWFVYVVVLPEGADRESVIATLEERGVQTARYLPCIHLQPYMRARYGFEEGLCPVAESASARTLALPFHTRLEEDDQAYIAEALGAALR
jgi:perosamine synthetase